MKSTGMDEPDFYQDLGHQQQGREDYHVLGYCSKMFYQILKEI